MADHDAFLAALAAISGTGHFHSAGQHPFFLPGLMVEGVGEVAFPLPEAQARELRAVAEAAPFGKGTRTVLDSAVRKCWQLDATAFAFQSPAWAGMLAGIVASLTEDLGIRGTVSAVPYKLLLYGKGGHFKPHKDTEKLDAMFGSLIIALPSRHEGGRLLIRHGGAERAVDFSDPAHLREFQYAAFFADCEHEVEPVRSGYRLCLAYNLRLDQGDPSLLNLPVTAQSRTLIAGLEVLKKRRRGQLSAVLLEHSYTEANLSLANLKGNDQARALALLSAAAGAGFTAHLALVTFHQSGTLEGGDDYHDSYRYRRGRRAQETDPDQGSMGEIYEESLTIDHWRDAGDQPADLDEYVITPDALIAKESISAGDPDEKEGEGYTGNAGCTMDYWYRRAAIVLWAAEDEEEILCGHDLRGACAKLRLMAEDRDTSSGSPFHRLARAAISRYPEVPAQGDVYSISRAYGGDALPALLGSLARANARELLDTLLRRLPTAAYQNFDGPLWQELGTAFGPEVFDGICTALVRADPAHARQPLFEILPVLSAMNEGVRVRGIAQHLTGLRPLSAGDLSRVPHNKESPAISERKAILAASHLLDGATLRKSALRFLLADGSLDTIRHLVGPVLLAESIRKIFPRRDSLAPSLRDFAVKVLTEETRRDLHPFPDLTRPCPAVNAGRGFDTDPFSSSSRKGDPMLEFAAFMADPSERTHAFIRPEYERAVIEDFVRRHALDVDMVTIRKGSPHTLSCTKNDQSHQRALARRATDEKLLKACSAL